MRSGPAIRGGVLAIMWAAGVCLAGQPVKWEPVGLCGGGGMFTPAISPADGNVMMVNCDMSAAYITTDGGRTWRMIHHSQLRSNTRCRPAFHPTDPKTIYAAGDWSGTLKVSRDQGLTWQTIGNLPRGLRGEIAIDPHRPQRMLAGTADAVFISNDAGATWTKCAGPTGATIGFHFDQTSAPDARVCFAATADGIWRSEDGGKSWVDATGGLPWKGIRSFAGGSRAGGEVILYCAIPSRVIDGRFAGGVYRSTDRGRSWQSAMAPDINTETTAFDQWAQGPVAQYLYVLTTNANPSVVYALNTGTGVPPPHHPTVYRSDDAGRSWRATFYPDPRWKPFNAERDYITFGVGQYYIDTPLGAAINAEDPQQLIHVGSMRCYITRDGGKTWMAGHARLAGPPPADGDQPDFICNGLVVTTTWNYYIDPFQPQRHYIAYTDIGFARSLDGGRTWRWWSQRTRAPWSNTCYELAFDPTVRGKIWGAFSNVHDIPNDNIISGRHRSTGPGGVCVSTDFGMTWTKSNDGQPPAPCTSVVVDPSSPPGRRTLYAGFFGQGVYKSTDDGKTWRAANEGLGAPSNMRVCRVQRHRDGTLFALITAMRRDGRFQPEGVGLWRSRDGGGSWERANAAQILLWPKDFTVDPSDSRIIYLSAADAGRQEAGLYRTTDGGATWTRLARKGPEHFGAYLHPSRPGWIYMTLCEGAPGSGLWLSRDNGNTWESIDGIPFANVQRITFDPADHNVMYVTTFGGSVWRGPADR